MTLDELRLVRGVLSDLLTRTGPDYVERFTDFARADAVLLAAQKQLLADEAAEERWAHLRCAHVYPARLAELAARCNVLLQDHSPELITSHEWTGEET